MSTIIGIDVGGTFTDIVVSTAGGETIIAKAATTPADQSDGVLDGIALAADRLGMTTAALLGSTRRIVHGTTAATNALLEAKAARVGMLTTEGHRDVIEMREGLKPDRYNLRMAPPAPLVPRRLRLPVTERIRADGSVEIPLDQTSLDRAIDQLCEADVGAVAVCFLHAWRNPVHEQAAAEAVRRRLPGTFVTTSSEVLPQIKEFERFSTTVANAAVGPVIQRYLERLQSRLRDAEFDGELLVILSHGGVASVNEATRLAAGTALSGPAGGVAAAVALARNWTGREHHRLRHGRHLHRHRCRARRAARVVRREIHRQRAHRPAQPGHRHAWRGWRIGRQAGPLRTTCRRSRKRRRGARTGLLRAGRHRRDGDGRQSCVGLPRWVEFPGWPPAPGLRCRDRGGGKARRATRTQHGTGPPPASTGSSTAGWRMACAWRPCGAVSIRAATHCWRSAAPPGCTSPPSPRNSASPGWWCR